MDKKTTSAVEMKMSCGSRRGKVLRAMFATVVSSSAGVVVGCNEPVVPMEPGVDVLTDGPGAGHNSPGGITTGADDGSDSTEGSGSSNACLLTNPESESRSVHQCAGELSVVFGATGQMRPETKRFGFDFGTDSYSEPLVMACCDPFDFSIHSFCGDGYELACSVDLVQTMCVSLVHRLNALSEEVTVGAGQILALAQWVNENQDECMRTFLVDTGVWSLPSVDTCDPVEVTDMLETTWSIPNSDQWPDIVDPFITLDSAEIVDIYIPDDGSALPCTGPDFNDGVSFPESVSERVDDTKMNLGDGHGVLVGPAVRGYGGLRSLNTGCGPGHCSNARFRDRRDGTWELSELSLYGAAPVTVEFRGDAIEVDSFSIVLESTASGWSSGPGAYQLAAQSARFVIGAKGMGMGASVRAANTAPISIVQSDLGWTVLPFTVSYEDSEGVTWELAISQTEWLTAQ